MSYPAATSFASPKPNDCFYIFGKDKDDSRCSVLRYDPRGQQPPTRIVDMERPRQWATYSVLDGTIYIVGGKIGGQDFSPQVSQFLPKEARLRERAPLTVGRHSHATVVLEAGNQILLCVFGGEGGRGMFDYLSSCELYNAGEDRWYPLPDMLQARACTAAASLPGDCRVFVFGGYNHDYLDSVEYCTLTEGNWQKVVATATAGRSTGDGFWQIAAPMRAGGRDELAATAFRGRFIIAGGQNDHYSHLHTVELFTPPDASNPAGQWTKMADMQRVRAENFTLLTTADAVFALGGNGEPDPYNTVEMLSPSTASADAGSDLTSWRWSSRSPLEELNRIVGAVSLPQ